MHKMMLFMVNPFKRCWRQHHDHAGQDWFPFLLDNAGSGNGFPKGCRVTMPLKLAIVSLGAPVDMRGPPGGVTNGRAAPTVL
jgi:hypothetical protein